MLTGCAVTDNESVETPLSTVSRCNDQVQGGLFDPNLLAPTCPDSIITKPFRFNAYYGGDWENQGYNWFGGS